MDPAKLAVEVQKLRNEWKALDQQHAGVPKAVWERFDGACEKAYAPAARHFAEMAAQRKEARRKREEFIAAAAAHVPTLLAEPRDWRAIERWLRETDRTWREGDLGSVEPGAWKKLDARLKAALLPLRDALSSAREGAKAGRQALIAEATALAGEGDGARHAVAGEGDPGEVAGRGQGDAARAARRARAVGGVSRGVRRGLHRAPREAQGRGRTSQAKRKEDDERRHGKEQALEEVVAALEQLAQATDKDDAEIRRALRDAQDQWKQRTGRADAPSPAHRSAFQECEDGGGDDALDARPLARSGGMADARREGAPVRGARPLGASRAAQPERTPASEPPRSHRHAGRRLPALPAASEKKMLARRDAALAALADPAAAANTRRGSKRAPTRGSECLLELEMLLKLDSPAELQALRLALQVKQLKERFSSAATGGAKTPADLLLQWCAQPGVADARDRQRCERVFAAMAKGG